jgi:hypothetical protein
MTERRLEKRLGSEEARDPERTKLYEPFMFLHEQFGYSVKSIYRQILTESPVDLGVYPDTFPNNIAEYYWIEEGRAAVKSWKAIGLLKSGLYFYYTAYCNGADGNFKNGGHMNLWMVTRYSDIIQYAMDNDTYAVYIRETIG